MQEIKILVPIERVPDFYKWFGAWLGGSDEAQALADVSSNAAAVEKTHWANTPGDLELAKELWAKLSERARALFVYLMERPGETFTGEELAEALGIPNGVYGVAGVLAWPGRYCHPIGKHLPIRYVETGAMYWMERDVAEMFVEVRDSG